MSKINITIITVTFNAAKYLESTIKSVIEQRDKRIDINLSYIIVDGNSTDNTISIIKEYNHAITQWISEPDTGIYDAMNKGWDLAHKDSYILFLGAGDAIYDLPKTAEYSNNLAIIGTVKMGDDIRFQSAANFKIKLVNTLHHQSLLLHKSLSIEPPFRTNYQLLGDYDFNARLYNQGVKFVFSSSFLSYALPGGTSSVDCSEEQINVISNNFGFFWKMIVTLYHEVMKKFFHIFGINAKQIMGITRQDTK
jgi:glycosyltransferase involved in cell wall biosynthesis